MGKVFKAYFIINVNGFAVVFPDLVVCQLESSFCQPFLRCRVERFFKVSSKGGYAARWVYTGCKSPASDPL